MNYLYNGIELPALPNDIPAEYKYIFVEYYYSSFASPKSYYNIWAFTDGEFFYSGGWKFGYTSDKAPDGYVVLSYKLVDNAWQAKETTDTSRRCDKNTLSGIQQNYPVWTSFDIPNPDGSPFMDASYPINAETGEKVDIQLVTNKTTAEPIDPQSYLMGFRVGQLLQGMR